MAPNIVQKTRVKKRINSEKNWEQMKGQRNQQTDIQLIKRKKKLLQSGITYLTICSLLWFRNNCFKKCKKSKFKAGFLFHFLEEEPTFLCDFFPVYLLLPRFFKTHSSYYTIFVKIVFTATIKPTFFICYLAVPRPIWNHYRGIASLTQCYSLRLSSFDPKVTGNLVTRLGP